MYGDQLISFGPLPPDTPLTCSAGMNCVTLNLSSLDRVLSNGDTLHFTLSATNRAGLSAFIPSMPFPYVSNAPLVGLVLDINPHSAVAILNGFSYHNEDVDVLLEGDEVGVHWRGFSHPYTNVTYSVALGTVPGTDDIAFTPVGNDTYTHIFHSPPLVDGLIYYATVIAETGFSSSNSSSDGVLIFREGQNLLRQVTVYDGAVANVDVDYHVSLSEISAQWFVPLQLHSLVSHYMWAVLRHPETPSGSGSGISGSGIGSSGGLEIVRGFENIGKDVSSITSLQLNDTLYVIGIQACFSTQCYSPVYSNGFHIATPPTSGSLRAIYTPLEIDDVYGTSSAGQLSIVWQAFTDPQLAYYEWSLGTGPSGKELLLPWRRVEWSENSVSTLVNVTVSLHHVNKVTLRGYNSARLCARTDALLEWNVDGIVMSQDSVPRSPLMIFDVSDTSIFGDTSSVSSWRDIVYREVALEDIEYSGMPSLSGAWPDLRYTLYSYSISEYQAYQQDCTQAVSCGSTIHNFATVDNLTLTEGWRYYFCVRALEEHAVHRTSVTPPVLEVCSNGVTVDLSAPEGSCIAIVSLSDTTVGPDGRISDCTTANHSRFQVSTSELYLTWSEFTDVESSGNAVHFSGVADYQYAIGESQLHKIAHTDVIITSLQERVLFLLTLSASHQWMWLMAL